MATDTKWATDKVRVGKRFREKVGPLDDLIESIRTVGLLHPIVVTPDGTLVAGFRRLAAVEELGWKRVPVTVVSTLDSAQALLAAERDENTCRLDMTPSEKAALGIALEELERPKAQERRIEGNREGGKGGKEVAEKLPATSRRGEVRQIVGDAVGMSGTTYQRAAAVVRASEDESLPDDVREKCIEAREEMDRTGKVAPSYNAVAALVGLNPIKGREPVNAEGNGAGSVKTKTYPGRSTRKGLESAISTIIGISSGLSGIDVHDAGLTADEAKRWEAELRDAVSTINRLRKNLRGIYGES